MRAAAALSALLFASPAACEPGRTGAAFLQRTLGARAAAMGSAHAAVSYSPDAVQYNPAALATIGERTLSTTYLNAYGSTNFGFLGYAHPLPLGVATAGAVYFNAGRIELNLSNGTRGTVTAEEDLAAYAGYALPLAFGVSIGATARFLRMQLAQTATASSQQGDFGIHWKTPLRGVSLGGAYQYLGPNITFESAGDPPPRTMRAGVALRFPDVDARKIDPSVDLEAFDLTAAADVVQVLHEDLSPRVGLELGLTPQFLNRIALRTGWVFGRAAEGLSFGLGYRGGGFALDYAFGNSPDLGGLQHLSLTFYF
ncbi:MAG: hypothetical protein AUJ52_01240 [Elusimicrobia bacterium CG1_02_63_36]|nr:MAG: hypothetical protein AUJ52_01240 [Elusimicrobia bacterium CG1_02_63_36]